MSETYETGSEEETIELGTKLAQKLPTKSVVLLIGNLGAGKTTIAKGIAKARGVDPNDVSSPTFTLIHEYNPALYHIDLYRLDEEQAVERLGLQDLYNQDATVLIEWGERFPNQIPKHHYEIHLSATVDDRRMIEFQTP